MSKLDQIGLERTASLFFIWDRIKGDMGRSLYPSELQKRADRADQSVLFFLAGANFWEKHAKNCAIMSMAHITYAIAH